jgi:predicted nucleotidyltransferase
MNNPVPDVLEDEVEAHILFAAESGSRAWDLDSEGSDYDVRGVYRREVSDYVTTSQSRDETIEFERGEVDVQLWDAAKACRLLGRNAQLREWTESPTIYAWSPWADEFKATITDYWNPRAYAHHYRSLAKGNYQRYIERENFPEHKKYVYVVRALCQSLRLVRAWGEFVHTCFDIDEVIKEADLNLLSQIRTLMWGKRNGQNGRGPMPDLDLWIEKELADLADRCNDLPAQSVPHERKDELLHSAVGLDEQ